MSKSKGNMYSDSVLQWNVFCGCKFSCSYCRKSFQAQMKRQKPKFDATEKQYRGCQKCYDYEPHTHAGRLMRKLPETTGDQFIWVGSSGDISFCEESYEFPKILERIQSMPEKTFFFQTKNPEWFQQWEFPKNVLLGITLESDIYYPLISKAPKPYMRAYHFYFIKHPRKVITIEPILKFNPVVFLEWIKNIGPERVYIGYDTKKNKLPEPKLTDTLKLILSMRKFTKVKRKLIREAWDES